MSKPPCPVGEGLHHPVAQSFRRCVIRFIRVAIPSRRLLWQSTRAAPLGRRPYRRANYSYKRAYKTACARAGVDFRWHDARHTFVTCLAENPTVNARRPFANWRATSALEFLLVMRISVPGRGAKRSQRWKGRGRRPAQISRRVPTKSPTVVRYSGPLSELSRDSTA